MNTKQAEYATAAEKLTGETRAAIEGLRSDMAKREIETGKRENRQLIATVVTVGVATSILGVLITAQ
ncbi:MAG: hypothetical protein OXE56_07195 [Gammaproteobacteria bacterium]|nr:hypothetical protein [Gammaproteobacteria bacterium]